MADSLSERDDLTYRTLAIIEGTTAAEQRRIALAGYARRARQDENVARIVALMLRARRRRDAGPNVIRLAGRTRG